MDDGWDQYVAMSWLVFTTSLFSRTSLVGSSSLALALPPSSREVSNFAISVLLGGMESTWKINRGWCSRPYQELITLCCLGLVCPIMHAISTEAAHSKHRMHWLNGHCFMFPTGAAAGGLDSCVFHAQNIYTEGEREISSSGLWHEYLHEHVRGWAHWKYLVAEKALMGCASRRVSLQVGQNLSELVLVLYLTLFFSACIGHHSAHIEPRDQRPMMRLVLSWYTFPPLSMPPQHLIKKAKDWGVELCVMAQLRFDIPTTYKFHKRNSVDVEVDLIRLQKQQAPCDPKI